jgi:cytochrome P450
VFHGTVSYRPGSPEYGEAIANVPGMVAELQGEIDARRRQPRDDLLTQLVEMEVDGDDDGGRRLTDDELVSVLWNLVAGGLDTTTSLTSLTLYHLDGHHDLRRRLVDQPRLLGAATDEFLRYFSVNETLTRTVTRDVELGGQRLRRGDHLMLSWLSANRDPRAFERPDEVDLDREPTASATRTWRSASGRTAASGCTWPARCSRSSSAGCWPACPTTRSTGRPRASTRATRS